jgi:flagellar FliJ protein
MKKFHFSLEDVLELRKFEEETAQLELGRAVGEGERIKQDLETTARMRVQTMGELRNASADEGVMVDTVTLMALQNYLRRLDQQKERLLAELAKAELVIAEKRALFVEALKNREIFTNLKETEFVQWRKGTRRKEDTVLDDIHPVS